jgi:sortase A
MNDAKEMQEELLSYEEEKLIMYTCYPFETLVGTKQDRLFVFADKISGPVVE